MMKNGMASQKHCKCLALLLSSVALISWLLIFYDSTYVFQNLSITTTEGLEELFSETTSKTTEKAGVKKSPNTTCYKYIVGKQNETSQTRKSKFRILSDIPTNLTVYNDTNFFKWFSFKYRQVIINKDSDANKDRERKYVKPKDLKTIILYTPLFQSFSYGYSLWERHFPLENPMVCRNGYSCALTTEHSQLSKASGVVVSLMGLPAEPTAWIPPGYSPPADQKWVAIWHEAPWYFNEHRPYQYFLQALDNIFDWTISYREDSTFNEFYQKGCRYVKRDKRLPLKKNKILSKKTDSVLWVVSHCNVTSNRDQYAKELSNAGLVNVTILGKCSESGKKADDAFDSLENYYFYLSFENSLCDDYITEKFFDILKKNVVPVVMGAPRSDYDRIAPPKSFIHVGDYPGPEELAQYLAHLQNHKDEYYSYLSWKSWYKLECPESWPACQLCQKLYEDDERYQNKQINNFTELWNKKKCYGQDYTNTNISMDNF